MQKITTDRILKSNGSYDDIPVATTDTVYTKSKKISYGSQFAISLRAKSSTGTPDIDVYHQQTHIDPESVSTGEGSAGDVDNGWASPNGASKLIDITDENWHHFSVSPIAMPYLRLYLSGQGTNPADCTVEIHISKQEDIS